MIDRQGAHPSGGRAAGNRAASGKAVDDELFHDLRRAILELDPATLDPLPAAAGLPLWGALMEIGTRERAVSLVTLVDGTTSVYLSTGGGIIGAGDHEPVAAASVDFLSLLGSRIERFTPDTDDSLPEPGLVVIRVLTYDGRRRTDNAGRAPRRSADDLVELYAAGRRVLTEIQLASR